jgi:hypothetical protein
MTALMQAHLVREAGFNILNFQDVREEFHELIDLFRNIGIPMQVFLDMQRTTARWTYDIVIGGKILYEQVIASLRKMFETGIRHRLSAAGLIGGVIHVAAIFFQ